MEETQISEDLVKHNGTETPATAVKIQQKPLLMYGAVVLVAILILGALLYSQGLIVAAKVNGESISRLSVLSELEDQAGVAVLDSLISDILIEQAATEAGVTATEIATIESQIVAQGGTLEALLAQQRLDQKSLTKQIRMQKLLEALLSSDIAVTDEEIDAFLAENGPAPEGQEEKYDSALTTIDAVLPIADHALHRLIESAQTREDLAGVEREINDAISAIRALDELLYTHSRSEGGYYVGDAATLYGNVRKSLNALNAAWNLWTSTATRAAIRGELLLTGRAGVGKSHLLCDVARRRILDEQPTILILGQEFDNRALMTQIPELGEFVGTTDDLLSLLDAAGEATGHKALLMIDAINESDDADRWTDAIPALRLKAARYPHVGLVISCRTEFVEPVVGRTDLPTEEHYGFAEATDTAVRRFASEYNLDVPTFPVFNPEFGNPLFLRLTCEALETLGTSRFVLGSAGLTTVCDAFVEATNKRLSGPQRCDYDSAQNLVQATIQQLAQLEGGHLDRADVARITTNLLPDRPWSKSLMKVAGPRYSGHRVLEPRCD